METGKCSCPKNITTSSRKLVVSCDWKKKCKKKNCECRRGGLLCVSICGGCVVDAYMFRSEFKLDIENGVSPDNLPENTLVLKKTEGRHASLTKNVIAR